MTEARHAGRHLSAAAPELPEGVAPDEVWVPPDYEPVRPGDFVEYATAGWEVKKSHRGLTWFLALVLVAALAGGGWFFFLRDKGGTQLPTCAAFQHYVEGVGGGKVVHITDGGSVPTGIPAPDGAPARVCSAVVSHKPAVLAMWPGASETDYAALLAAGGWTVSTPNANGTLYVNGADPRRIETTTVEGVLMVAYQR